MNELRPFIDEALPDVETDSVIEKWKIATNRKLMFDCGYTFYGGCVIIFSDFSCCQCHLVLNIQGHEQAVAVKIDLK